MDAKAVARFVGMTNFFHKFIPNFVGSSAPLSALLKKGAQNAVTSCSGARVYRGLVPVSNMYAT
jgi:hypothetical protein